MTTTTTSEPKASAETPRSGWRRSVVVATCGLFAWFAWQIVQVAVGANLHAVIPGRVYRCGQPTGASLDSIIAQHGIRTVVNLRGFGGPQAWYLNESRACQKHDVNLEDVSFSAIRLPSKYELRNLVELLERAEAPLLIHCRHGSDRTGLAAVAALLLLTDTPCHVALRQLSLRYGHMPIGRTTQNDRFFTMYEAWLHETEHAHTSSLFRRWALEEYHGGPGEARWESVACVNGPPRVGVPLGFEATVRNTSKEPWRISATTLAGTHVYWRILTEADGVLHEGRAGLQDETVGPGKTFNCTLVLPPFQQTGRYRLFVDMLEENHGWFYQFGSEPWEEELVVRE